MPIALGVALAVALLSGAAVIALWMLARGAAQNDVTATPPVALDARDAGAASESAAAASGDAGTSLAGANVRDDSNDDREDVDDVDDLEEGSAPPNNDARPPRKVKRARPPLTPLPDLAAHMDYLARWCARASCAPRVLASRGKIPVLDVVGLRALRRDAEACVAECRR